MIFRIADVATPILTRYRETSQKVMELKPATINRRLITLKRFFDWAVLESTIRRDPSKPVKLVPEGKVSPRHMTDKEEAALIAAAEHGGSLRDQTILIVMLHTGLRTMEICDLAPSDIQIGKRSGQLTVRSDTKYEHLEEIRKEYGYQTFTLSEYRSLCKHLLAMQWQMAILYT